MAWTNEQLTAINGRGKNILVSAAAGSGKTAVLVERVIRRLTNPEKPEDITDFLIVTFTNAAAAEMRSRIAAAVGEALAANPKSAHLRRQINLIHSARIMTVHSFCLSLIRDNFHALNINPDFRLLSEDESDALKDEALQALLEKEYQNAAGNGAFLELVESVCGPRDDKKLEEMILSSFDKLMNLAFPEKFIVQIEEECGASEAAATKWGRVYLRDVASQAKYLLTIYDDCIARLRADCSGLGERYLPGFCAERDALAAFASAAEESDSWDGAKAALEAFFETPKLAGAPKGHDPELKEYVRDKREYIGKQLKKLSVKVLAKSNAEILEDIRRVAPVEKEFMRVVMAFRTEYESLKNERGVLDFNDLEHLALKLLVKEEGGELLPAETAFETGAGITELMVDEYQDTNGIQDEIFKALTAAGASLFVVGDVKQSIYRFRGANPGIFNERKNRYDRVRPFETDRGEADFEKDRVTVTLKNNFRSSKGLLDGVNFVFRRLMSESFGEMAYTDEEELTPGPDIAERGDDVCELDIIDMAVSDAVAEDAEEGGEPDGAEELSKLELEAKHIALRIRGLLESGRTVIDKELGRERKIEARDIAVLLRARAERASVIAAALGEAGIDVFTDAGGDFLATAEINALFSLLAVIDNPMQDLYLLGALRSPVFGFTADELGEIRLAGGKKSGFYDALTACAKTAVTSSPTGIKCERFLKKLSDMRLETADMGVGDAVGAVIDAVGADAIFGAMDGGEQRRANLRFLFDLASGFEQRGGCDIGGFLKYLADASAKGKMKVLSANRGDMGGVRIMTIHHSKGLEFPVVILACTTGKMNEKWRSDAMLFHPELGAGFFRRDTELGAEYTTLLREAVATAMFNEQLSEELRGLYVAMTRAREKLIVTAIHKNAEKELGELTNDGSPESIAAVCKRVKSLGGWIETAVLGREDAPFKINRIDAKYLRTEEKEPEADAESAEDSGAYERIQKRLRFSYPYAASCKIPAKLTATGYRGLSAEAEEQERYQKKSGKRQDIPKFLLQAREMPGTKYMSPRDRGISVHLAMQLLPVRRYAEAGEVEEELKKLCARDLLSAEQAGAVAPEMIIGFYETEIGRRVCALSPDRLNREFKFSILADAGEYYPELAGKGEKLLLQGVIDLYFEENDGTLTVVDFKTDNIKKGEAALRAKEYAPQLAVYKRALSEITGKQVSAAVLYFFETGETVTV